MILFFSFLILVLVSNSFGQDTKSQAILDKLSFVENFEEYYLTSSFVNYTRNKSAKEFIKLFIYLKKKSTVICV
jgi:hypothetical protein